MKTPLVECYALHTKFLTGSAVIVLVAPTNRLADLRLLLPRLLPAIDQAAAGHVVLVS